jgi:CHASE3 domain sensor protein
MYKDLLEMRAKGWKLRRELETAKTLDEIRKDAERDERIQAQQSQQAGGKTKLVLIVFLLCFMCSLLFVTCVIFRVSQ